MRKITFTLLGLLALAASAALIGCKPKTAEEAAREGGGGGGGGMEYFGGTSPQTRKPWTRDSTAPATAAISSTTPTKG